MFFSELYKIIVNKVTFVGFEMGGAIAPIAPRWIRPWGYMTLNVNQFIAYKMEHKPKPNLQFISRARQTGFTFQ